MFENLVLVLAIVLLVFQWSSRRDLTLFLYIVIAALGLYLALQFTPSTQLLGFNVNLFVSAYVLILVILIGTAYLEWGKLPHLDIPTSGRVNVLVSFLLVPPLEEIIFRSVAIPYLFSLGFSVTYTIGISALLFSLWHLRAPPDARGESSLAWHLLTCGLMGLIFGYVFVQTSSLLMVMLLHYGWNLSSSVLDWD